MKGLDMSRKRKNRRAPDNKTGGKQSDPYKVIRNIIVLVVIVMLGVSGYRIWDVQKKQSELISRQKALIKERERLSRELLKVEDPQYIEEQARTQLKMVRPGEILYIFPVDEESEADLAE